MFFNLETSDETCPAWTKWTIYDPRIANSQLEMTVWHFEKRIDFLGDCINFTSLVNLSTGCEEFLCHHLIGNVTVSGELSTVEGLKNYFSYKRGFLEGFGLLDYEFNIKTKLELKLQINDLCNLYMYPIALYRNVIDEDKYNNALRNRLEYILKVCKDNENSLQAMGAKETRDFVNAVYINLMLPLIVSPIPVVHKASRKINPKDRLYEGMRSVTECARNVQIIAASKHLSGSEEWKKRIESCQSSCDLRRFLLLTCFYRMNFVTRGNSGLHGKNILLLLENFFEDSYITEHTSGKHTTVAETSRDSRFEVRGLKERNAFDNANEEKEKAKKEMNQAKKRKESYKNEYANGC
jgi:hypothetical protein